jgi:hypothetical protein
MNQYQIIDGKKVLIQKWQVKFPLVIATQNDSDIPVYAIDKDCNPIKIEKGKAYLNIEERAYCLN